MSYFYILFCITLLLLSKYTLKLKLILVSIIGYICYINFSVLFSVEEYVIFSTLFIIVIANCFYNKTQPIISIIEILSIIVFKILELLLIVYPTNYISNIGKFYIYLDDVFISSILFVLFSREVGYHPFKIDKNNLRKYILTTIISYLTLVFIL